ncbi:MAG: hypothetical protein ACYC2O_10015, partial [Microthrixaceae bacterium]
ISLGRDPEGAAPQLAAGFGGVAKSPPALVTTAIGAVLIWALARFEAIGNWSFLAAAMVFVFAVVPLLPLLFAPSSVLPGRRIRTSIWMVLMVVAAAAIPWGTSIESNGMRIVAMFAFVALAAITSIGIFGVNPMEQAEPGRVAPPSPDMFGIDRPISRADALDAGRVLGIDEELLSPGGAEPVTLVHQGAAS